MARRGLVVTLAGALVAPGASGCGPTYMVAEAQFAAARRGSGEGEQKIPALREPEGVRVALDARSVEPAPGTKPALPLGYTRVRGRRNEWPGVITMLAGVTVGCVGLALALDGFGKSFSLWGRSSSADGSGEAQVGAALLVVGAGTALLVGPGVLIWGLARGRARELPLPPSDVDQPFMLIPAPAGQPTAP